MWATDIRVTRSLDEFQTFADYLCFEMILPPGHIYIGGARCCAVFLNPESSLGIVIKSSPKLAQNHEIS